MNTQKFKKAIERTLSHEGGYVNDPVDPGGETNWGISKRSYPNVDIKNLTRSDAIKIYYDDYWCKGKYYKIIDETLAGKVFDAAVNMGITRANKILQKACNQYDAGLIVDGKIGPNTIMSVNTLQGIKILQSYKEEMWRFYTNLISRKPSLGKYRNGWRNRAFA